MWTSAEGSRGHFLKKKRADVDGGWGVGGRGSRRAPGWLSEGSECSVQEWVISV